MDIYSTRLTAAGAVISSSGVAISSGAGDQLTPAISSVGGNYLVVWEDDRNNSPDIYGTRVTGAGSVSDPSGIPITFGANTETAPAVAFNGSLYLVAWQDDRNATTNDLDIYAARITPGGTLLDPGGIPVCRATNTQYQPQVAAVGSNFLVVWADLRNGLDFNIYGARVTGAGTVADPNGFPISTAGADQISPTVAANGTTYLVAWQDWRNSTDSDIYAARVTTNGVVTDPAGFVIAKANNLQASPAAASDGTNYIVVWQDYRNATNFPIHTDVYGARVADSGTVLDTNGIAICTASNDQTLPAVTCSSGLYLVVWEDLRNTTSDIYAARVNTAGTVLDPNGFPVSTAAGAQMAPAAAPDGSDFIVVWQDGRNAGSANDTYAARVFRNGNVWDTNGFPVDTGPFPQLNPVPASSPTAGQSFVVCESQTMYGGTARIMGMFTSMPRMQTITHSLSSASLTWSAQPGRSYRLQFKNSLETSGAWNSLVPDIIAPGHTATGTDNTISGTNQRFYRVIDLP
jgi:hypothetical protein